MHRTQPSPVVSTTPPLNADPSAQPGSPTARPLLGYAAAAKHLGVSVRTTRTLVKLGKLPAVKIMRRVLIDPADLSAFVAASKSAGGRMEEDR